jgi:signal peptidase I
MTATTTATKEEPGKPSRRRTFVEWVVILVLALGAALLIKTFLIQAFWIPSGSMLPTLRPGDRVLVNKISYDLHPVHEGDVVVFRRPPRDTSHDVSDLIKRVIGLPGERIEAKNGQVYINGKMLSQPYLPPGTMTTNLPPQIVPKGEYFVMGDNRSDSYDSRYWGDLPGNLIVGRAFVRVWPPDRIGGL